jgi:iron complex outermembrane receptor protein
LALLSALTLIADRTWAQTAPAATAPTKTAASDSDAAIQLDPFKVTTDKDKGYKATNAVTGTRLNTQIKDVPLNLEVITNEFIRDTGGTNLREALRYSAGVILESQSDAYFETDSAFNPQTAGNNDPRGVTRNPGDSTIKLRGFVIEQVLRDGFRRNYSADWINIDRVDVLRGPSALLYGVGSFGGVVNYSPKLPQQKAETYFGVTIGTNAFYRGEIDVTGPMGDGTNRWKPAYRVTAADQSSGDFTEIYKDKHWMIAPAFSFQPFKNTTVLLDNEFGYSNRSGNGFQNIRANVGNQAASPSRSASWITDQSNGAINTRTFRWSGPDTYLKGPFRNNIIDITQKINDNLFVKVGYDSSQATFDSRQLNAGIAPSTMLTTDANNFYANGTTNLGGQTLAIRDAINLAKRDVSGMYAGLYSLDTIFANRAPGSFRGDKLYGTVMQQLFTNIGPNATVPQQQNNAMIWYQWKDYNKVEKRDQIRAETTYSLDIGKWGRHTFLGGVQYMKLKSNEDDFGPAYSYTNLTTKAPTSVTNEQRNNFKNPGDYSVFRFGTQGDGQPDVPMLLLNQYVKQTWDLGYYAVYQGQFFKDRLTLIAGERWDRSDARQVRHYVYEQGHPDQLSGPGSPGTSGSVPSATSPQVGATFRITRSLSVFGLYSTGVVPNPYAADGNGNILKPTKAVNKEVGLKFDLFNGRLSGTISGYEIKRTGQPKEIWWAPSPYKSLQQGWDPAKPNVVLGSYTTPDAMWALIHNSAGLSTTQGLALAKKIWSPGWYTLLDEVAAQPSQSAAYNGPLAGQFWTNTYAFGADVNTSNYDPNYSGNLWFPLFNISDPDVAKGFNAIRAFPGWNGNYFTDQGKTFRFSDGTKGFTNGPGANGAFVPMNDQARGWDASLIFTPTDWLQIVANYAHVDRKVTSQTYQFVKLGFWPAGWWMQQDANFGTFSPTRTPAQAYADINDSSTYRVTVPDYNNALDDSPANTASLWMKVSLEKLIPAYKGWEFGVGGNWQDRRQWFSGFTGGGGNIATLPGTTDSSDPTRLVKFYTKPQTTVNAMVSYTTRLADKYEWRVSLNVDNLLDDQSRYGLVYAPGMSARFSSSIRF